MGQRIEQFRYLDGSIGEILVYIRVLDEAERMLVYA